MAKIVNRCFRVDGHVVHVIAKGRHGYLASRPVGTGAGHRWGRARVVKLSQLNRRVACPVSWKR